MGVTGLTLAGGWSHQPTGAHSDGFRPPRIRYVAQYQARWLPAASQGVADINIAWTDAMYGSVKPWLSGNAHQGYIDPSLPDWQREYYGVNLPKPKTLRIPP